MSKKEDFNPDIRCHVKSCTFNADGGEYCSLHSIHVEPCQNGATGKPEDESMCGSYKAK